MKIFAATPAPAPATTKTLTYVVESDAPTGVITYSTFINGQLGQEQATNQPAGVVTKDYTYPTGFFEGNGLRTYGLSAQAGDGASSITCKILLDGQELMKQSSTGPYTVVSCTT
jgi:hypothetical protein